MSNQIRSIKNVELSSLCNMSCGYCLSPHIKNHRDAGLMSLHTFRKVIDKIEYFYHEGTQGELWLHGTGESLLNRDVALMVFELTSRIPIDVALSTNGLLIDDNMILSLKEAGVKRIDVSCHDEEVARKAHLKIIRHDIFSVINYGPRDSKFNWAGQLEFDNASTKKPPCPWIGNQECFVLHDGSVVSCCFDVYGKKVICNIDDDVTQFSIEKFELCQNCNHTLKEDDQ